MGDPERDRRQGRHAGAAGPLFGEEPNDLAA
jgi:hypothetical protein